VIFAVIPLALITAFHNETWAAVVCSIVAIGIIVLFSHTINEIGQAAGVSAWRIGKVITMISFSVILLNGISGGGEDVP